MHEVLLGHVKPSAHETGWQWPEASQLSPSAHVPGEQLGSQVRLGSGVQEQSISTATHTSPDAQSESSVHSCAGIRHTPQPAEAPGGKHEGAPPQSALERQGVPELGSVPGQSSWCSVQVEAQNGPAATTVPPGSHW